VFEEDGSLDPLLRFLLYAVLALAIGKMLWRRLTEDIPHLITVGLWGWGADHPWWTALIAVGSVGTLVLLARPVGFLSETVEASGPAVEVGEEEPVTPTFRLSELTVMSPVAFEQACADLLARDGFVRPRRVGGAGDLGADVVAWGDDGLKVVMQCKRYARPVGSQAVQTFNGTARPEHGADVAVMVALNGFSRPAADFAARHDITLLTREGLKQWAHGRHLYSVIGHPDTTW